MKAYKYILATCAVALSLGSCSNDESALLGEGRVVISPKFTADATPASRANQDALRAELNESFILWLSNDKGVIRQYKGLDNLPGELGLLSGTYVAEAWAGDSVPASWDKRWFHGIMPFEVKAAATTPVVLNCKIANVVASVEYSADVDMVLQDYQLEVGHSVGHLVFDDEHKADKAYFMMNSKNKDLTWTLTGTKRADGVTLFTRTSKIENVKPGYEYVFKVSCTDIDEDDPADQVGGAFIQIEIEEIQLTNEEEVIVPLAPKVTSSSIADFNSPLYLNVGEIGEQSFQVSASSYLTGVRVTIPQVTDILGIDNFDVLNISTHDLTEITNAGITFTRVQDEYRQVDNIEIVLSKEFTDTYFGGEDTYTVGIRANDEEGFETNVTASFCTKALPIVVNQPDVKDAWFSSNTAKATGVIPHPENFTGTPSITFGWRVAGTTGDYATIEATVSGDMFEAIIEGLTAGTEYELIGTVTGGGQPTYTSDPRYFTTEPAFQLPNAGFEEWQTSSSPYLVYAAGGQMFWDTGNHGSSTLNKNVTVPDYSLYHSGSTSICLQSQFVGMGIIGKFAAGNVFIGEYLGTDGTDGIIGFGRPFTGRPSALKGYVKYVPGTVEYTNSGAPDIVKGENDKGIIYMALLDSTTNSEYPNYPVVVKTKTKQLFNKDAANVIAYGEIIFSEATPGDGLVEFTCNFDYVRKGVRPSYIMITASASKGGDYFSGGASTMWLDDLELVY